MNSVIIMSVDFAKQADVAESLGSVTWDLMVVDEVQLVTPDTQRGKLVMDLLSRAPMMRALFLRVGGSLDSPEIDRSSGLFRDAAITVWSRENLRDHEGRPLLPEVHIEWVAHHRHADEAAVLARLQDSLQSISGSDPQTRLIAVTLLQSASSSLFALEQRLRRLRQRRNELAHGIAGVSEAEQDAEESETVQPASLAKADQIRIHLELAEIANPILQMLEDVASDSKCGALLNLLTSLGVKDGAERRVCVFTRFVDTATYLEITLRDRFSQVRVLTGSHSFAERERGVADFAENGGILIATEAVATPIPEVAAVVFYDLPLNPAILEARIGQFVRVGRHGSIRIFTFTDESHALLIERLQRRIAEAKEVLGAQEIDRVLFSKDKV